LFHTIKNYVRKNTFLDELKKFVLPNTTMFFESGKSAVETRYHRTENSEQAPIETVLFHKLRITQQLAPSPKTKHKFWGLFS